MCSFLLRKNACLNYRKFDLEGDLVGVPNAWYLSAQSFITLTNLFEESRTCRLWMSGKRNVSVCSGHELANALYLYIFPQFTYYAVSLYDSAAYSFYYVAKDGLQCANVQLCPGYSSAEITTSMQLYLCEELIFLERYRIWPHVDRCQLCGFLQRG